MAARLVVMIAALYFGVYVLNQFRGLPFSLLLLCLVAFAAYLVMRHTRFGRYLHAIGGNPRPRCFPAFRFPRLSSAPMSCAAPWSR